MRSPIAGTGFPALAATGRARAGTLAALCTLAALAPGGALAQSVAASPATETGAGATPIESIEIVARRLNEARGAIETQVGASVYTLDAASIDAMPLGDNSLLNQVALQAPSVAQDSFGQFHVRGEHNGLQYRINGIILPEGLSGFGQSLDPRLVSSMALITGALPSEYGLRTAGVIDITTKSGGIETGGNLSVYGGSHGTIAPSFSYGATAGRKQFFVSGDAQQNDLGIESPDGSATPLHDRMRQYHLFGYFENLLGAHDRVSLIVSASSAGFQIPDLAGQAVLPGLQVNGVSAFDSARLDETQREQTQFAILSWQRSADALDVHNSITVRNSSLQFTPDPLGDLLFNGISQQAAKRNLAFDWQTDAAWHAGARHTVRVGAFLQFDSSTSRTGSLVLPADPAHPGAFLGQPVNIADNDDHSEQILSLYAQDEWTLRPDFTVNYGLRVDRVQAFVATSQVSPRLNFVWTPAAGTTVHAGAARYFSPPPFELVGLNDVSLFRGTSAEPTVLRADPPLAERANYLDVGVMRKFGGRVSVGLDTWYKRSQHLLDEGQFGAPIILTPFNYATGRQYGEELTLGYSGEAIQAYLNLSGQRATGRGIESAQFNFSPDDLCYSAGQSFVPGRACTTGAHDISLDHEQRFTASGGLSYARGDNRVSADFLLGSGLRASLTQPDGTVIPNGMHLPWYTQVNAGASHVFHSDGGNPLTARLDIVNVLDRSYQIRNGTGVGVGAPQFGPRRGFFLGLSMAIG